MPATLYLETYGLSLKKTSGMLRIARDQETLQEISALKVASVVVAAEGVNLSGGAVRVCMENNIPIFFFPDLKGKSSVLAPVESRWPERQAAQIRLQENPDTILNLSRAFVTGKVRNQLSLMKYFKGAGRKKDRIFASRMDEYEGKLPRIMGELKNMKPIEDLRLMRDRVFSAEGRAAIPYWKAVRSLVPESMNFPGRVRQGATDPVNCLLNYGYAILGTKVHQCILEHGLSTYFSFLHTPQRGRPSLVYDLMEEFRAWAVDRVVLGMIGKGRCPEMDAQGKIRLEDRRFLIQRLEKRWATDDLLRMVGDQITVMRGLLEKGEDYRPVVYNSRYSSGKSGLKKKT